jgi:hypothetical protein
VITNSSTNVTSPSLLFKAGAQFVSSQLGDCLVTYRAIQVSWPYEWCESQAIFALHVLREPTNRTITTSEASPVVIPLGSIEFDGTTYVITVLILLHSVDIDRFTVCWVLGI